MSREGPHKKEDHDGRDPRDCLKGPSQGDPELQPANEVIRRESYGCGCEHPHQIAIEIIGHGYHPSEHRRVAAAAGGPPLD